MSLKSRKVITHPISASSSMMRTRLAMTVSELNWQISSWVSFSSITGCDKKGTGETIWLTDSPRSASADCDSPSSLRAA